jgi:hypothetical protein
MASGGCDFQSPFSMLLALNFRKINLKAVAFAEQ